MKVITSAEGGMTVTNKAELHRLMGILRTHGITRDPEYMTRNPDGPWYYEQIELGFNYRMTDLQAALGLNQLARLEEFVVKRNELAQIYDKSLSGLPIQKQWKPPEVRSARHLYIVRVDAQRHKLLFETFRSNGIGVNLHYIPVHLQPYYRRLGFKKDQFSEAEAYSREAISLPIYPSLTSTQQEEVISIFHDFLKPFNNH